MGIVCSPRSRLGLSLCAAAMCAGAALAGPAQAAPPAAEERPDGGGVQVTPVSPRPGDEVELRVHGCVGAYGTARSEAFVARVRLAPAPGGGLFGEAKVRSSAEPGVYPIDVACEAKHGKVTGRLIITGRDGGRDPGHHERPGPPGPGAGEHHERPGPGGPPGAGEPTGPVRAGGGGTAAGGGAEAGPAAAGTTGLTLLSCALVSGALLAVWRLHARES
ncbi:hypothetical protein [Streptomyces sp. MP131-18]|uniref:hypothetical protein n=1 Tax=Streptomyces sp. MP131-18 TaxID=1857892 RepID=UPI00097C9D8B|nr:hypothetical protein [Streptomyces sp. MP131-18]ONK13996.1 hypothetical protein STBA_47730 [Streptomyces sp. MP131-18]